MKKEKDGKMEEKRETFKTLLGVKFGGLEV